MTFELVAGQIEIICVLVPPGGPGFPARLAIDIGAGTEPSLRRLVTGNAKQHVFGLPGDFLGAVLEQVDENRHRFLVLADQQTSCRLEADHGVRILQ